MPTWRNSPGIPRNSWTQRPNRRKRSPAWAPWPCAPARRGPFWMERTWPRTLLGARTLLGGKHSGSPGWPTPYFPFRLTWNPPKPTGSVLVVAHLMRLPPSTFVLRANRTQVRFQEADAALRALSVRRHFWGRPISVKVDPPDWAERRVAFTPPGWGSPFAE